METFIKMLLQMLEEEYLQAEKDMGLSDTYEEASRFGGKMAAFEKAQRIVNRLAVDYNNGWISTEEELPPVSDELLLVQCSGRYKNIVFEDAYELASYTEEGWILEKYPGFENIKVVAWQQLPPAFKPKGE